MQISPAFEEFGKMYTEFSHIPLFAEIPGDLETPVSIYLKIKDCSDYSFLLESALQGGASGRYSFLGIDPEKVIALKNDTLKIREGGKWRIENSEPVPYLQSLLAGYTSPPLEDFDGFGGGLVGYFAYDAIRLFENIPGRHPNDLDTDDMLLMLAESIIVYDHYTNTIRIIIHTGCTGSPEKAYRNGCEKLAAIADLIRNGTPVEGHERDGETSGCLDIRHETPRGDFENIVAEAKKYIEKGDVFQIVLSQRLSVSVESGGFDIYRELRRMNPSPYMFFLRLGDTVVTGSSPEVLVKSRSGKAALRPLAGTRRRGTSLADDREIAAELLSDEKERAEHVMLVDLGRNDLGRFCKYGTVKVPEFMEMEYYSHVMHIVSEVTGEVDEDRDSFDVLRGCFPAGTVSGAPKIRAMELINLLEPSRRGVYSGAVGYFDFHDNMDTCIAIRTMLIRDKTAYVQAGAGIVADSVPENEYFETLHKAHALVKAIAAAEGKTYDFGD